MNEIEIRKSHIDEIINHAPLNDKINGSKKVIREFLEWCENNNYNEVLVTFSGGKDSTVLLDLVALVLGEKTYSLSIIPAYAIEITFPATIKFIKETVQRYQRTNNQIKDPLFKRPSKAGVDILNTYGYPIFSKQVAILLNRLKRSNSKTDLSLTAFGIKKSAFYVFSYHRLFLLDDTMTSYVENGETKKYFFSEKCCDHVKGGLKHDKRPAFIGTMAIESKLRRDSGIKNGCNVFNGKQIKSRPLSLGKESDIGEYIKQNKIPVNDAYGYNPETHNIDSLRFNRLGCTSCPLGSYVEEVVANKYSVNDEVAPEGKYRNRFEKIKEYSPALYSSQIGRTGIYRIIADMDIKIRNDPEYMEYYHKRRAEIKSGYENISINLMRIMIQVEQNPYNKTGGTYTDDEIRASYQYYNVPLPENYQEIISKLRA